MMKPSDMGAPWRVTPGEGEDSGYWLVLDRFGAVALRTKARGIAFAVVVIVNGWEREMAISRVLEETARAIATLPCGYAEPEECRMAIAGDATAVDRPCAACVAREAIERAEKLR